MRYERVKITRDTNTVHNRACPPWEIPVLEFIFDDGNVQRQGVFEPVEGEYPDAAQEFDRLQQAYGTDTQSGIPHVVSVYGNGRQGIRKLNEAILAAKAEDDEAEDAPAPVVVPKRTSKRRVSGDSLLS
jgi:hypothetical protein